MFNRKRPLETKQRAIVIGGSSGIGAALVHKLVREGYDVAALARREELLTEVCTAASNAGPGKAHPYRHDVTDYDTIPALFQQVVGELGGLDLIAYVTGMQESVAINEYNFDKDRRMIRVNLLGAIAWLNQAAIRFERAETGHIVGVSSIAGDRGRVGAPVYNTSKAGLNTYLEALRNRLANHGATVTTIKPGFVDTIMLENAPRTMWVISTEEAAEQIYRAVRWKLQTVYVPLRWTLVGLAMKHIPSFIFRRLNF